MPEIWRRSARWWPTTSRRSFAGRAPTRLQRADPGDGRAAPLAADRLSRSDGSGAHVLGSSTSSPRLLAAGFFAAGFFAAGFFAAGFFAAGLAAGFAAGFAGAAAATVVSTILAPAASFCTDATPLIAARLVSYAWLEATTWPLVETSEKRNFPVGPFLTTNFPGTSASRSEDEWCLVAEWLQAGRRALPADGRASRCIRAVQHWARCRSPEFLIAITIAAGISMATFAHADRHGNTHATAWGIGAFLAAGIVVPVYVDPGLAAQAPRIEHSRRRRAGRFGSTATSRSASG